MIKKLLVLAGLVVGFTLLTTSNAYACSCLKPEVSQAFQEARAVFLGEVVEIVQPHTNKPTAPLADRLFQIKFKVDRIWKGTTSQEITILSDQGRAGCFSWGPFVKGRKYLVFAERRTPSGAAIKQLAVLFRCNLTESATDATDDIKALDAMKSAAGPLFKIRDSKTYVSTIKLTESPTLIWPVRTTVPYAPALF